MLAAQGYQESQLNQQAKSHVGAVGIMQLMPDTGAQMKVGDIHVAESNIHAGVKYMDQLMEVYFPTRSSARGTAPLRLRELQLRPRQRRQVPQEAEKARARSDKWFNNVEIVVAQKIGTETTTYVRNIYKYYVAYRLTLDAQAEAEKARKQVAPTKS
jgi:membrane-bound lytic murein transglycosylase MltF